MGVQIEPVHTPVTLEKMAAALKSALRAKLGREPNQILFLILLATIWMETARGQGIYNHNVGNVTVGSSGANYHMFVGNVRHFRAYRSLEDGVNGYLFEILRRKPMTQHAIDGQLYSYLVQYRDSAYCPDCNPDKLLPTFEGLIKGFKEQSIEAGLPTDTWTFILTKPTPPAPTPSPSSPSSPSPGGSSTERSELLKRGARGKAVVFWQSVVAADEDGKFGPETERLTKAFQTKHHLPASGVVDALTWAKALPMSKV